MEWFALRTDLSLTFEALKKKLFKSANRYAYTAFYCQQFFFSDISMFMSSENYEYEKLIFSVAVPTISIQFKFRN